MENIIVTKTAPRVKTHPQKLKGKAVNSPQERRRTPRLDNNIPLKIRSDDFDIVTETKNLSSSGAYCRINKYLEPMTKLKIVLLLPIRRHNRLTTKKISCEGIIVRTESVPGEQYFNVAIYFSDIPQKDVNCLNDYINSSLKQSV